MFRGDLGVGAFIPRHVIGHLFHVFGDLFRLRGRNTDDAVSETLVLYFK